MLTLQTLILLKKLRKLENPYILSIGDYAAKLSKSPQMIRDANGNNYYDYHDEYVFTARIEVLNRLLENSYIYTKDKEIFFTHKGYRYFQISAQALISFLGRSIVTPIIVSMITSLITIKLQLP